MSEMAPVVDAQRGAAGRLLPEPPTTDERTSWAAYVRELESSNHLKFVPTGEVLTRGRVYIDLRQPCRGPFRALQGQTAGSRNRYLAQEDVPAAIWFAIVEHCACVDAETGALGPTHHIPCNRLSLASDGFGPTRLFAA
jgi:hypothetical protein